VAEIRNSSSFYHWRKAPQEKFGHSSIAFDQHYLSQAQFDDLVNQALHTGRLLAGFMNYLKKSQLGGLKYKTVGTRTETRNQRLQAS